jgi:hypothetical protein
VNAMSHGSIAHLLRGQPPALRLLELLASLVEIFDLDTSPWLDAGFALLAFGRCCAVVRGDDMRPIWARRWDAAAFQLGTPRD